MINAFGPDASTGCRNHSGRGGLLALGAALLCGVGVARGDERMFTYSSEAVSVLPKGGTEFEQWVTYRGGKQDGVFARWDFREELEYGVSDRYTTALYLNFRNVHSAGVTGISDTDRFEFRGVSSEHKYQLLNPHTKPLGVLLYGEVTTDGKELELEEKLVLQKFFADKWNAVFNVTLEQEWEFEPAVTEETLALELTTGLSYQLSSHWSVGVEAMHVREFEGIGFGSQAVSAWFVGPNIHYGTSKWWATLTVLPQVAGRPETEAGLNLTERERVEVRFIAGINF